jgi:hypothetical protein
MAEVAFSTWQAVLLIVLCFGSLLLALYCLLFMVPLKSFVERVNSLGGGMRGIRAQVDGALSQTEARLEQIEAAVRELRAELEKGAGGAVKLAADLGAIQERLADLKDDVEVLEGQLSESVQRQVAASCRELEGVVLAALEAVRDEMLRGANRLRSPRETRPPVTGPPPTRLMERGPGELRPEASRKIIPAWPLLEEAAKSGRTDVAPSGDAPSGARGTQQPGSPAS